MIEGPGKWGSNPKIDPIHQPGEKAAVDVLSQSIPSVLSLQGSANWLVWQPQNRLKTQPPPTGPLTWTTFSAVTTFSLAVSMVLEHKALSSSTEFKPTISPIS